WPAWPGSSGILPSSGCASRRPETSGRGGALCWPATRSCRSMIRTWFGRSRRATWPRAASSPPSACPGGIWGGWWAAGRGTRVGGGGGGGGGVGGAEVGGGLAGLGARRLVHGAVVTSNVLLTPDGDVRLSDAGLRVAVTGEAVEAEADGRALDDLVQQMLGGAPRRAALRAALAEASPQPEALAQTGDLARGRTALALAVRQALE